MSRKFQELMDEIASAMENRTIEAPEKKMANYVKNGNGDYNPLFSFVWRNGKIACIWCGNRRKIKDEKELARINDMGRSTPYVSDGKEMELAKRLSERRCAEGFNSEEWDELTLTVMRSLDLKL